MNHKLRHENEQKARIPAGGRMTAAYTGHTFPAC
jgi:hypothetical protein